MKNILSYKPSTPIKGSEIKSWILFHTEKQTEYTNIAQKMIKYLTISDNDFYTISKGDYQASERIFRVIKCV